MFSNLRNVALEFLIPNVFTLYEILPSDLAKAVISFSPVILSIYLKIIATVGFSLQNVSLVSLQLRQNFTPMEEWEIYFFVVQRKVSFVVFSGVILHLSQIK